MPLLTLPLFWRKVRTLDSSNRSPQSSYIEAKTSPFNTKRNDSRLSFLLLARRTMTSSLLYSLRLISIGSLLCPDIAKS